VNWLANGGMLPGCHPTAGVSSFRPSMDDRAPLIRSKIFDESGRTMYLLWFDGKDFGNQIS
jgi:hypothetical protein